VADYLDQSRAAPISPSIVGSSNPAISESAMTTILLHPGERAVTTPRGWLDIAVAKV
jgi:hypothetical protein